MVGVYPSPNVDLQAVLAEQSSSQKIAKENFTMVTDNEPLVTVDFLKFLKPGCGVSVVMKNKTELFRGLELFNHEIFQRARKISLHYWKAVLRDDQLVNLAAEEIDIRSRYITSGAIDKPILVRKFY
ncbi:unnamed protein product [Cylicocyclus nassatus]|uniref:Uncharacterized protein n=1 Tax=Cylicocyclus nassatus TaxID=53992 RepID=A0AA36H4C0_CYLNA|nr:unnamed protein product [Cylicocyclus nassatus]